MDRCRELMIEYIAEPLCFRHLQTLTTTPNKKGTARPVPAVQVREETPGKGQRQRGCRSLNLQIGKPPALTGLNFWSVFVFRTTDARQMMTATPFFAERGAYRVRPLADQLPCSRRNASASLIASATKRSFVSASGSPVTAAILRSNMIDAPPPTSTQVRLRARIGVTSLSFASSIEAYHSLRR